MGLRAKMLASLAFLMLALTLFLGAMFEWRASEAFTRLEARISERDIQIATNLFDAQLHLTSAKLDSYALWEEAFNAAGREDREWARKQISLEVLEMEQLDFLGWWNDARFEMIRLGFDRETHEEAPFPAVVLADLEQGGPLWPVGKPDAIVLRYYSIDGRLALVASNPVRPTSGKGEVPDGRMVAGRWLEHILPQVEAIAAMPMALTPAKASMTVMPLTNDGDAEPAGRLYMALPTLPGGTADEVRVTFFTAMVLAFLVFAVFFAVALERVLLRPLSRIQEALRTIVETGNRSLRVSVEKGNEAFRRHSTAINEVLEGLQAAEIRVAHRLQVEQSLSEVARQLRQGGDRAVNLSLETLGRNLDVDVLSYYRLTDDQRDMACIGTFRSEDRTFGGGYDFVAPAASWVVEAARRSDPIIYPDVEKIPDDQKELREFVQEYGLVSFMALPLPATANSRRGVVAFGHIRASHQWSGDDLRVLEVIAELFAHAGRDSRPADPAAADARASGPA